MLKKTVLIFAVLILLLAAVCLALPGSVRWTTDDGTATEMEESRAETATWTGSGLLEGETPTLPQNTCTDEASEPDGVAQIEAALPEEPAPMETPLPEPADADFVRVRDYIPDLFVELRYATENNFTEKVIYEFEDAYLRYGTVKKLMEVQGELRREGLCLKIWDAFRPVAAQYRLWEVYPVDAYVANPNLHYSSHNRGNTVDITMVNADGSLIEMPTDFDDFSPQADRDYSDCGDAARENARHLENTMSEHGFLPYYTEWWHYSDVDEYPVEKDFLPPAANSDS